MDNDGSGDLDCRYELESVLMGYERRHTPDDDLKQKNNEEI